MGDIVRFESGAIRCAVVLMSALEKISARKASRIFAPSRYAKKTICRLYGVPESKVEIMPNGLFFGEWTAQIDAATRTPCRPPTVLSVARLYKRKGLEFLIKAWPIVLARLPLAVLRIVGDGLERRNLEKLSRELRIENSVVWEGSVLERSAMARYFADCDVFCLPSLHETFGLVFIEAMSAGKAVVAFNTTAVPEVVRDSVDGFLLEPGDYQGIAEKIISLLQNRELCQKMGANGRERVKNNFDMPCVITPLVNWLEQNRVKQ